MGRPARTHDRSRRPVKVLLDQNLSIDLVEALNDLYPGIAHVKALGMTSASDRTICSRDGDFYHWAVLDTPPKFL